MIFFGEVLEKVFEGCEGVFKWDGGILYEILVYVIKGVCFRCVGVVVGEGSGVGFDLRVIMNDLVCVI